MATTTPDGWTARPHYTDYSACLALADAARAASLDAIRYQSVRDPNAFANIALLSCRTFAVHDVVDRRTWHLYLDSGGVRALCEFPRSTLTFDRAAFVADPRMTAMRWER